MDSHHAAQAWLRKQKKIPSTPESKRAKRRSQGRPFGSKPAVEFLEDRTLLSVFYNLTPIASTLDGTFTHFGDLVAINNTSDEGDVAFVASTAAGNGLWITGEEPGGPEHPYNVNPSFSNDPTRDFGLGVALNDNFTLTARSDQPRFDSGSHSYLASCYSGTK